MAGQDSGDNWVTKSWNILLQLYRFPMQRRSDRRQRELTEAAKHPTEVACVRYGRRPRCCRARIAIEAYVIVRNRLCDCHLAVQGLTTVSVDHSFTRVCMAKTTPNSIIITRPKL